MPLCESRIRRLLALVAAAALLFSHGADAAWSGKGKMSRRHRVPIPRSSQAKAAESHDLPRFAEQNARTALRHGAPGDAAAVAEKVSAGAIAYAKDTAAQAAQAALKFHEAGAETMAASAKADLSAGSEAMAKKADASAGDQTFKVTPEATEGVSVEPAPGQNDPAIKIRPQDEYMDEVRVTTDFIGGHSYQSDVKALLGEVDQSENKVKGLKLRIVEKENFIDSLIKREDMLQDDLRKDKVSVENLYAHIKALKARVERIKKEKQLAQLEAQFHQYSAATAKMEGQVEELQDVRAALQDKMRTMQDVITPLRQKEDQNMRLSINADADKAPLAPPTMPVMPVLPVEAPAAPTKAKSKAGGEAGAKAGAEAGAEAAKMR